MAEMECPVHGPMRRAARRPTATNVAPAAPIRLDEANVPAVPGVDPTLVKNMIRRAVKGGFNQDEAVRRLPQIFKEHSGYNLETVLVYEGFANEAGASRVRREHELSMGRARVASVRPQMVPIEVLRPGDEFVDGEIWAKEEVVSVQEVNFGGALEVTTNATVETGAGPYVFNRGDSVWGITRAE